MKRIQKIQNALKERKLSAALITNPHNVRYLCRYVGTNGRLFITPKKAVLITDFRYLRSARKQIPRVVEIYEQKNGLKKLMGRYGAIGFEEKHMTQAEFKAYKKALSGVLLRPISGMVESFRMIKTAEEIKRLRKACRITDSVFKKFSKTVKVGQSEDEMEWNLLKIARQLGAEGFSFPPIICFGKNTADVHHIKEPNKLKKGEPVLLDMGIEYQGYMTDMTRMIFPKGIKNKIYPIVLEANLAAIKAIRVGMTCSEVDKVARDLIKKAGYGKHFGHSTGHGVGLEVHEAPTVSEKSGDIIQPGMVFTIEPGIYLDHLGGVRIEDMVYVNEKGQVEVLTKSPK